MKTKKQNYPSGSTIVCFLGPENFKFSGSFNSEDVEEDENLGL
jgi:hypothetical protein